MHEPAEEHRPWVRGSGTGYFSVRCTCGASAGGFTTYAEAYGYAVDHERRENAKLAEQREG